MQTHFNSKIEIFWMEKNALVFIFSFSMVFYIKRTSFFLVGNRNNKSHRRSNGNNRNQFEDARVVLSKNKKLHDKTHKERESNEWKKCSVVVPIDTDIEKKRANF